MSMLINNPRRLSLLMDAQHEIRALRGTEPSGGFYQAKLTQTWERATETPTYRELGQFSAAAFRELPVTSKDELKARPWDFVATELDDSAKYYETTGTTGRVTPTPRLAQDVIWNAVSVAEAWRAILNPHDRVAVILPSDVVPVADLVVSVCEYLDLPHSRVYPFATGICDWDRLLDLWQTLRPTTLFVAPGVALQLTRLLKQRGRLAELSQSVHSLMLLGEVSTEPLRQRLGDWWGATAYDASYGSTETGTLAATCSSGRLHLLTATNYFEVDTDQGLHPIRSQPTGSERGRLVVTPLNLHARPLLRLDTGDEVEIGGDCDCGDLSPVLAVSGRSTDVIRVHGSELTIRTVEDLVYGTAEATGYLVEVDSDGREARLLLERDVDADRSAEPAVRERLQRRSSDELGFSWDDVMFVNSLPSTTKSGGSQKSWKRSNIRVKETT
jgi:phenylacetate-CoA ligase